MNEKELAKCQELLRERLTQWCGQMPPRRPLRVREIYRREFQSHTEIKLSYDGETGERIPAYLLVPRTGTAPFPGILATHQCGCKCDIGKEQVVGKCVSLPDQAYGLELVQEGFVVLAPDANKVGERYDPALRQAWQCACEDIPDQSACCCSRGGSWGPIRWKPVFDVMRGIDLLIEHNLVDSFGIGMIGHSLGADTILWSMPLDDRICAAVISGGGIVDHPGRPYGLEYSEILSLIAPRPFLEITGQFDRTNCCQENSGLSVDDRMRRKRQAHAEARRIYALADAEEKLACLELNGGHSFPESARRRAYDWLNRWLARASG